MFSVMGKCWDKCIETRGEFQVVRPNKILKNNSISFQILSIIIIMIKKREISAIIITLVFFLQEWNWLWKTSLSIINIWFANKLIVFIFISFKTLWVEITLDVYFMVSGVGYLMTLYFPNIDLYGLV